MKTVQVEVVTPGRKVFEGEAEIVIARGYEGELGVRAGHIPLVTPLEIAPLRVKHSKGNVMLAVGGGFLEVRPNKVTVLAETAEVADEIDVARAEEAKKRAEERLEELKSTDYDYKTVKNKLARAENRLRVVKEQ